MHCLSLVIVIIPVLFFLSLLFQEGTDIYQRLQSGELDLSKHIEIIRETFPAFQDFMHRLNFDIDKLKNLLTAATFNSSRFLAQNAIQFGQGALQFLISLGLMLYLFFGINYRKEKTFSKKETGDIAQIERWKKEQLKSLQEKSDTLLSKFGRTDAIRHSIALLLNNSRARGGNSTPAAPRKGNIAPLMLTTAAGLQAPSRHTLAATAAPAECPASSCGTKSSSRSSAPIERAMPGSEHCDGGASCV